MPFITTSGFVNESGPGARITWSEMAEQMEIQLRWDPPVQPGEYLHDHQREELRSLLRAFNVAKAPLCGHGVPISIECDGCNEGNAIADNFR